MLSSVLGREIRYPLTFAVGLLAVVAGLGAVLVSIDSAEAERIPTERIPESLQQQGEIPVEAELPSGLHHSLSDAAEVDVGERVERKAIRRLGKDRAGTYWGALTDSGRGICVAIDLRVDEDTWARSSRCDSVSTFAERGSVLGVETTHPDLKNRYLTLIPEGYEDSLEEAVGRDVSGNLAIFTSSDLYEAEDALIQLSDRSTSETIETLLPHRSEYTVMNRS